MIGAREGRRAEAGVATWATFALATVVAGVVVVILARGTFAWGVLVMF